MSEEVSKIEDRIQWLKLQIIHEAYYPGAVVKGLRNELTKLQEQLKNLKGDTS